MCDELLHETDCYVPSTEPLDANQVGEEFFKWCDEYHPLKLAWEKWEKNKEPGSESYPYSYFQSIAKGKITELVNRALSKQTKA